MDALASGPLARSLDRRLVRLVRMCIILAAVTGIVWVVLLAAITGDGWRDAVSLDALNRVFFATQFGLVWQLHLLLSIALLYFAYGRRAARLHLAWSVIACLSGLQLATLGLVGHAIIPTGMTGVVSRTSQAAHLVAAGFWLGSLVPVWFCLRNGIPESLRRDAMAALHRFSNLGHFAVAVVIVTGVLNMALIDDKLTLTLTVPYQALLAAKIVVVSVMVALAIVNRYGMVPRLKQNAAALDHIRRICTIVFWLGIGAVGLVSIFGTLSPT